MTDQLDALMAMKERLATVNRTIADATKNSGRNSGDVQLLAVSKTQTAKMVKQAFDLGQTAFGENYLQEAREKQDALSNLPIEWHFIGPIQSNKTREIAEHFDWIHSVDRLKIAQHLSNKRPEGKPPLNICLQVNVDNEAMKSGVLLHELPELIEQVAQLPSLKLRGLMAIPAPQTEYAKQLEAFHKLTEAAASYPQMDTLSMGMSSDIEAAIAAGSTIVRVGTGIFGKRNVK